MEEFSPAFLFTMTLTLVICALGLVGNGLCALVLWRPQMRSSYNYLLIGLNICDSMLLITGSIHTMSNLKLIDISDPTVQLLLFLWDWTCTGGVKYFTVGVSLERCFVVCFPMRALRWLTISRAKKFACFVALFVLGMTTFSYCYFYHWDKISFNMYAAIVLHFAPFLEVFILNTLIYFKLRVYQKERQELSEDKRSEQVSVTRMLLTVVLVFGFCYSFEFARRVMVYLGYVDYNKYSYYDYTISHLADVFYVLNSAVNLLIYCLMGRHFRNQFLKVVCKCRTKAGGTSTSKTLSSSDSNQTNLNRNKCQSVESQISSI